MNNNLSAEKNRRILIVDDNRAIHDDFRKILSPPTIAAAALDVSETSLFGKSANVVWQIRYEIDSAYQGQEGVMLVKQALAAGRPYAMAFVDVRMPPGMDGVETTRKIWTVDPEVQICLCTAYSDYSWDEMFEKIGNRDGLVILKKPFDTVEALQLAHALTEKWWLHQQSKKKMEELESMVAGRTDELQQSNHTLQMEVVKHQRAAEALLKSEEKFRQLADNITDVFWICSPDFTSMHYVSPGYELIWGRSMKSLYANPHQWIEAILPEERKRAFAAFAPIMENKPEMSVEYRIARPDGTLRWIHDRGFQVRDAGGKLVRLAGIASDITERKKLEAQLFQSQKLETVGKLAGGFAHEFNSILTAIIGQSELLLGDLPAGNPLIKNATEISKAANRAARLTQQLLAYGRKQFLRPEALDLNRVIASMQGMLQHLMGGSVDTQIVSASGLQAVEADAGQLEQVIMNMVINARDAMPNGGKLTLETANVAFDKDSVGRYPELKPGDYVMLAISDTGMGMSDEVKARVFEPFFSTKGVGQGTGLGLSTCYGIVKQSGGHISVYSEQSRGTTFKIYLPQVEQQGKIPIQRLDSPDLPSGTETILLVEDDPALREMAATLLRRLGYTVLTAANGVEALSVKHERNSGHIDLLFTDVVMPHMSGKELADRVLALYPDTKILFTSAYTENAIVHQGVLNRGVDLLQKPFTPSALAHKLREVLDQKKKPVN